MNTAWGIEASSGGSWGNEDGKVGETRRGHGHALFYDGPAKYSLVNRDCLVFRVFFCLFSSWGPTWFTLLVKEDKQAKLDGCGGCDGFERGDRWERVEESIFIVLKKV